MSLGLPDKEMRERTRRDETAKRTITLPGIGVICATAMEGTCPAANSLQKGRDFAAWLCPS